MQTGVANVRAKICLYTEGTTVLPCKRILPRIKARRCSHASATYAYVHLRANCCFQIQSTRSHLCSVQIVFLKSRYDLDLAKPLRIRIDLDPDVVSGYFANRVLLFLLAVKLLVKYCPDWVSTCQCLFKKHDLLSLSQHLYICTFA